MAKPQKDRLNLRIDAEDRALLDSAAQARRETLTQFLVESGRERAERVLADRNTFTIDPADMEALLAAMDEPARERPELAELFARERPE